MGSTRRNPSRVEIETWEWDILTSVAARCRTSDPETLKTELVRKLTELKTGRKRGRQNRRGYLWKALWYHALNVMRREHGATEVFFDTVESFVCDMPSIRIPAPEAGLDRQVALKIAFREFTSNERRLWQTLHETGYNLTAAAKKLGVHRNTVSLWLKRIEEILKRHGLL